MEDYRHEQDFRAGDISLQSYNTHYKWLYVTTKYFAMMLCISFFVAATVFVLNSIMLTMQKEHGFLVLSVLQHFMKS